MPVAPTRSGSPAATRPATALACFADSVADAALLREGRMALRHVLEDD